MLSIFGLLGVGTLCGFSSLRHKATVNENVDRLKEQGAFLPRSGKHGEDIQYEIITDWYNERKLFSQEYWRYFEINNDALMSYVSSLREEREIEEGYQPSFCGGCYNKHIYFPMKNFHDNWDSKIERFNKEMQEWQENYNASYKDVDMFQSRKSIF